MSTLHAACVSAALLALGASCHAPASTADGAPPAGTPPPEAAPSEATAAAAPAPARSAPALFERRRPVPPAEFVVGPPRRRAPSVAERLAAARLPALVLVDETSLRAATAIVAASAGVNVVVDPEAEEAFAAAGDPLDVRIERPMRATSAMDLIAELAGDDVAWTVRDGVVLVTTPSRTRGAPRTYTFDVSDLVRPVRSYAAPEWNVQPSGGLAGDLEDLPEPAPILDGTALEDLIRAVVAPGTWDDGSNSITVRDGKLIVTHD